MKAKSSWVTRELPALTDAVSTWNMTQPVLRRGRCREELDDGKRLVRPSHADVGVQIRPPPRPWQNHPLPCGLWDSSRDLGDVLQAPTWESLVEMSAVLRTKFSQGLEEVSNVLSTMQAWSWSSVRIISGSNENN